MKNLGTFTATESEKNFIPKLIWGLGFQESTLNTSTCRQLLIYLVYFTRNAKMAKSPHFLYILTVRADSLCWICMFFYN